MILEAGLYFVLGFLSAGLLALMVSPAIWNRAVILTKRKVESSIPLTLNEIQADKDQLRAEFSMSTRRLEMSVDELRKKASGQIAEISRKRDEITKYDAEKAERLTELRSLETKSSELGRRLEEREIQLEETSKRFEATQKQYVETLEELSSLRNSAAKKDDEITSQRIELAAKETRIDTLSDASLRQNSDGSSNNSDYLDQLSILKAELKREQMKASEAQKTAEKAKSDAIAATEKLRGVDHELGNNRLSSIADTDQLRKINEQLLLEREKTVDLEARVATQAIKMETLLNDASNQNVGKAVEAIEGQVANMQKQLSEVKNERDTLQEALNNVSSSTKDAWSDERKENALLRERMNDMAARIAGMAADIEGKESPVNKMLAKDAKETKRRAPAASSLNPEENTEGRVSLAERIRAIQAASSGRN